MKQNLSKKIAQEKEKFLLKNQKNYLLLEIKDDIFDMQSENLSVRKIHKILTNAGIKTSYGALLKFIKEAKNEDDRN